MRVRQSTLGDADKCLRAMQYSIESTTYSGGSQRALGTAYHYGLEFAYIARRTNGVFPETKVIVIEAMQRFEDSVNLVPSHESEKTKQAGEFRWDEAIPDFETAHTTLDMMLRAYFEHPDAPWPSEWAVIDAEVGFSLPLWGQHTRNGSIDLVLQGPDGVIIGEDHKTANKAWSYNKHHARKQNQSPWYVRALMELYPGAPGYRFFYDIMTLGGKFERRESKVEPGHIEAVDTKAVQVVTLYEGMRSAGLDLPANPASTLCSPKYCDHWDICPYGAALDLQ